MLRQVVVIMGKYVIENWNHTVSNPEAEQRVLPVILHSQSRGNQEGREHIRKHLEPCHIHRLNFFLTLDLRRKNRFIRVVVSEVCRILRGI